MTTDLNLITVSEFASFAPEVDTTRFDSPTISGIISQASRQVSDYLQYSPLAEDIVNEIKTAKITTEGDLLIFPEKLPIATVTAITLTKGTSNIDLELTDSGGNTKYNIDFTRRHIRFPVVEMVFQGQTTVLNPWDLKYSQFYVKLSYRGGYEVSELPSTIKQATVLLTKDIISNQYNQMGANRLRQGLVEFDFRSGLGNSGDGVSKFVKDAQRLLASYRRIG